MNRIHFFEIIDQRWCPEGIRDSVTACLQFLLCTGNVYACLVPRIKNVLSRLNTRRIIDLGSGGGGPWPRLIHTFEEKQFPVRVLFTDKFVNEEMLSRARDASGGKLEFHPQPVDALKISPEFKGFRTLFTAFHHFRPEQAKAIIGDAVQKRQGIGIFEMTSRNPLAMWMIFFTPVITLAMIPFIRPFKWSRLLWTYIIPIIPFILWFDGLVSCLRTYSPRELRKITEEFANCGYTWEIGTKIPGMNWPAPVTYLIGYPD